MHITVTSHIPCRNWLYQQLPSGSGSRPLRFCCIRLSYYQYTADLFQALPLRHCPAPHLPDSTIHWNILIYTHDNSFHLRPTSPADVPTAPIPEYVWLWVKDQYPSQISSSSPQAAFERYLQSFSFTLLLSPYPQIYLGIFYWASHIRLDWGTYTRSPPLCCCLLFNKGTESDDFETPHIGLAKVVAADRPYVFVPYFIRQLRR